jgi:hypothetical protein
VSNHIERDNRVAGGFGHLLAVIVTHQVVQVHVEEPHLLYEAKETCKKILAKLLSITLTLQGG